MTTTRVHPGSEAEVEASAAAAPSTRVHPKAEEVAEEVQEMAVSPPFRADKEHPYLLFPSAHVHEAEEEEEEHLDLDEAEAGALADVREDDASDGAEVSHAGGLLWHASIVSDDFADPKHCDGEGHLKLRRPVPQIRASDFFGKIAEVDGKWIFSGGALNGWPGLADAMEVVSVTCKVRSMMVRSVVKRFWDSSWTDPGPPTFPEVKKLRSVRATLRAPAWSARGYLPTSPGFAFWVRQAGGAPQVFPGRMMVDAAPKDARATVCHLFAHRYAKARETAKDLLTYHAAVMVEFDDGTATICELAYLHGLGGYGGRSNWLPPAPEGRATTALFDAIPARMQAPWRTELCEVRLTDVAFNTRDKLQAYLDAHTGRRPGDKFLDAKIVHSAPVRLAYRTKRDLFSMILNYVGRDSTYHEEWRNCQTFAADLYGFAAGKKGIEPYHQVCRVLYKPRPHLFLYDPDLY